jgi:hypothetical protein
VGPPPLNEFQAEIRVREQSRREKIEKQPKIVRITAMRDDAPTFATFRLELGLQVNPVRFGRRVVFSKPSPRNQL